MFRVHIRILLDPLIFVLWISIPDSQFFFALHEDKIDMAYTKMVGTGTVPVPYLFVQPGSSYEIRIAKVIDSYPKMMDPKQC